MIVVFGRAEEFQIESGTTLAVKINRVALVEVDAPRCGLRLPSHAFKFLCELGVRALRVIASQPLNRRRVAVSNRHDAHLLRLQINLKSYLVEFPVAIQIVRLRRHFRCRERARVFFKRCSTRDGHDHIARSEIRRDAFQFRYADDHIFLLARLSGRICNRKLDDFNARRSPRWHCRREQDAQIEQFYVKVRPQEYLLQLCD